LLDSELLSDVYLELIGGRQPDLVLRTDNGGKLENYDTPRRDVRKKRKTALKSLITEDEKTNHEEFLKTLGADSIWKKYYS
jgi:DNA polymerase-3 subunit epsilon